MSYINTFVARAKFNTTKVYIMISFILVLLMVVSPGEIQSKNIGTFSTMDECFMARESIVNELGRPIANYQAVCVQQTQ